MSSLSNRKNRDENSAATTERDAARGLSEGITLRYIDKLEATLRSMRELASESRAWTDADNPGASYGGQP